MIKRKATDYTTGLMAENTKGGGTRASSMALALILTVLNNQLNTDFGSTASE
jgi:hypothetical protein